MSLVQDRAERLKSLGPVPNRIFAEYLESLLEERKNSFLSIPADKFLEYKGRSVELSELIKTTKGNIGA